MALWDKNMDIPNENSVSFRMNAVTNNNNEDKVVFAKSGKNAVEVRDVDLTYGFGIKTNVVLTGMNITVPEGGIYALIGPSGCGKTSILRCIMGFLKPDSGKIRVFGKKPGDPKAYVPGRDLGYMPQDVALNDGLTIYEMMRYFGKIFLLSSSQVEDRIDHLVKMLEIPDKGRIIKTLSGGQRRRVSFACAVIHKPRLAILDEPTVGVDPIIREKIWDFMLDMCKEGKTILLTTHYIEETRRAGTIGFLRKGYLLAEEHPTKVIHELGVTKLEDAFYQMCVTEKERKKKYNKKEDDQDDDDDMPVKHNYPTLLAAILWLTQGLQQFRKHKPLNADWFRMLFALVEKFNVQIMRERFILVLWIILPVITLVVTCACIGPVPQVNLAIVNDEDDPFVSGVLIKNLDPKIFVVQNYTDPELGKMAVARQQAFAFLHFYSNFSETVIQFADAWNNLDNITFNFNIIDFKVDLSNKVTLVTAALSVYQTLPKFLEQALLENGYNPKLAQFPILNAEPVYGEVLFSDSIDFFDVKHLVIPGSLLYCAFATSMIVALYFLRIEKLDNMFERTYSAGVSATQIIVAQFIVRTFFNFFSVAITLWVALVYYDVPNNGSLFWVMVLMLMQNLSGLAYGLVFTSITIDPLKFILFAIGSVGSFLFFSGIMWPIEAQPYFFKWIAKFTPLAIPSDALRSIMVRGLPIWNPLVYPGFMVSGTFLGIFLVMAANFFNLKKL
ncbi:ABC transporter G family member 23 [Halotydeus destructor]|nr:ABC transporter G family member 23 [Halotydeus destructor]